MKNNPTRKKTSAKEVKKIEPLTIKGTIEYEIRITGEGYEIEVPRSIQNDLMCVLVTKDIVERRQVDLKITLESIKGADNKKFLKERQSKLVHTAYGVNIVATDIIMTILNKASDI